MKTLLIQLTHGLYEQDIDSSHKKLIKEWLDRKIIKLEDKKYIFNSLYRAGTISLSNENGAYLQTIGESIRDIFIENINLLGAKSGDLVIAQRNLIAKGAPQAKVIEIVGKSESYSVAIVIEKNNHKGLYDIKTMHPVGFEIDVIDNQNIGSLYQIDNQNSKIIAYLGNIEDPKVDEKIVLAQYNKHDEFDNDVIELAKSLPKDVDLQNYPNRIDLTHLPFCTIDPVTAKDFDDAIYFDTSTNTLYVAIADVSEYVEPFGAIDTEAIYRGFSIYLPHRSIPMLPRELSEGLCSLVEGENRLVYTFEITIDTETYDVSSYKYYTSIINSFARFTYEDIDGYLNGKYTPKNDKQRQVLDYILPLRDILDKVRTKRMENGYNFRSNELEMRIDENHNIISTDFAIETPSHALVEDCMLLANKASASNFERGIFRVHEKPSPSKFQKLYSELATIGIFTTSQGDIRESIKEIQAEATRRGLESEVDELIIRSQMQAKYTPYNIGHFGLGFSKYSHFTAPIRRYSDLTLHRLLKSIQAGDSEEKSYVLRNIESLCTSISEKERESAAIEMRYHDRKFARWAAINITNHFKARVIQTEPKLLAQIHDDISGAIVELEPSTAIALFDDLIIEIESSDIISTKIKAKYVSHREKNVQK